MNPSRTRSKLRRGGLSTLLVLLGFVAVAVPAVVTAGTANAAGPTITSPAGTASAPFSVSECTTTTNCDDAVGANDVGAPVAFPIQSTGWTSGTTVFAEICDGKLPTAQGWTPIYDCDAYTSPPPALVGSNGQVNYGTGNVADEIGDFRGVGPQDFFNCLAPGDVASSGKTQDGETIDTGVPSYTNCQLRLSTSLTAATADQQFVPLAIPNAPTGVTKATPAVSTVTGNPTSSTVGQSVTLTTTVSGSSGTPTDGTVNFEFGPAGSQTSISGCSAETLTGGTATCTTTALPAGTDSITAVYSGGSLYGPASSTAASYTVAKASTTTTVTANPTSTTFGGSTTITAAISGTYGTPGGTVNFETGSGSSAASITGCNAQPLSGTSATCTTSALPVGTNENITAVYSGDSNNGTSTGVTNTANEVTVAKATATDAVTSTPASQAGQNGTVTFTDTLTGVSGATAPSGTVSFTETPTGGTASPISAACTGVTITAGKATCTTSFANVGGYTIAAIYSGDPNYVTETAATAPTESFTVVALPVPTVTVTANPTSPTFGQSTTLTATIAPTGGAATPGGMVNFEVGSTPVTISGCGMESVSSGVATCVTNALALGPNTITAVYTGDSANAGNSGMATITVTQATPTQALTSSPTSLAKPGDNVTFTDTVSGPSGATAPSGQVGFTATDSSGTTTPIAGCTAVTVTSGAATCTTSFATTDTYTITATYTGDTNYTAGTPATESFVVATYTVTQLPSGYDMVAKDGGVFAFGGAGFYGSEGGQKLNAPIVGMAESVDDAGYWLVGSDGGVFAFGDAPYEGSLGNIHLNKPIVGIVPTSDGQGYWLVASDGGVFAFGDATFYGSLGNITLNAPIVGITATPDDGGYTLAASDGGVFAFGDAPFHGSLGGTPLAKPIVGIASTADSGGYWLVGADGGVFAFGEATYAGGASTLPLVAPITGIAEAPEGGYRLAAADGGVFNYGGATDFGSLGGLKLAAPIDGIASTGGTLITLEAADKAGAKRHVAQVQTPQQQVAGATHI